ncbi:hypothetical protein JYK22_00205, partial [Nonomuraea sp. RK-328]|nr:hypothetical protein [Nonomuraea sp. RK-328]
MTADQPFICPKCQGVTVAVDAAAYTPARGRLIVTHGYCRGDCSGIEPAPAHETPAAIAAASQDATASQDANASQESTPATVS